MSTQYNAIGTRYNSFKALPASLIECSNMHSALSPHISNASVLDLACGTGFYSLALLEWGASRVVGVDISSAMIEGAKAAAKTTNVDGKATFIVGDCSKPVVFEGGPFDVVVAVWLLNYAASKEEMAGMFACIQANLKPGGVFVGITPPPIEDVELEAEQSKIDPWRKYGVSVRYGEKIRDGYKTRVVGHVEPETVEFDNYRLRRSVFEGAAQEGMEGGLQWREITLPEGHEEVLGRFEEGFWEEDLKSPHFGVMQIGG